MGKIYGIEICTSALSHLSREGTLKNRLGKAISEMEVMITDKSKKGDISIQKHQEINRIAAKFRESRDGELKDLTYISYNLVLLCVEIIKENSGYKKN